LAPIPAVVAAFTPNPPRLIDDIDPPVAGNPFATGVPAGTVREPIVAGTRWP
jgi:hypothetical protein